MKDAVIETVALGKRFGSLQAIDAIDLQVKPGEVFGLLGPNGAGKSTTLNCVLGLIRPSAGRCSIFGHDCWEDRVAAHRKIGVLPSDFSFEGVVTGRELLALLSTLRGERSAPPVEPLVDRLRADLDRPLKELSRGNRQKIGLICALAHQPELVIMDEPTSGLDPLMQEEFLRIVAEIRADGRTVLLSSHNMAEVEQICDRVALIDQGRLLDLTDVDSLLARAPKLAQITFRDPVDVSEFDRLRGVNDVTADGAVVSLRVEGDPNALIAALAHHQVVDLVVERPTLESMFVELYRGVDR